MAAHTYFSLSLGPYDPDEAVATLPDQLDLLEVFRGLRRQNLALVYRLETRYDTDSKGVAITDELVPSFSVHCVGRDSQVLSQEEADSLEGQATRAFLPAWPVGHSREAAIPRLPKEGTRLRLRPNGNAAPILPIKADWTPLVDLLHRRSAPLSIDIICIFCDAAPSRSGIEDRYITAVSGIDTTTRTASEFFISAAQASDGRPGAGALAAHLCVHAPNANVNAVLAKQIGQIVFGINTEATKAYGSILFPRDLEAVSVTGSPGQIIRVLHAPYGHIEGRGLEGQRGLPIPLNFRPPPAHPGSIKIGRGLRLRPGLDAQVDVWMRPEDRLKHLYVIGKTGSGKTNLLKSLVRQDILEGFGVAVIDPHGDLVDYAVKQADGRTEDVILLDFSDADYLPALNPLLIDTDSPREWALGVEELLDIFIKRAFNEFTGPVFEDTARMMFETVNTPTLRNICSPNIPVAIDILRQSKAREWVRDTFRSKDDPLYSEWYSFLELRDADKEETVRWVLSKFADFREGGVLYPVTGADAKQFSPRDILNNRRILLVKIPEEKIGRRAAEFIGALIFTRLHRAARENLNTDSVPFQLYVDEFQKFVGINIEELVAEARKFKLGLSFAHQNLRQLEAFSRFEGTASPRLGESIFSNVGTMICMRTSGHDIGTMSTELMVSESAVRRLRQYAGLARCVVNGEERDTFTLLIDNAEKEWPGNADCIAKVRNNMIDQGYWQTRKGLERRVNDATRAVREQWDKRL